MEFLDRFQNSQLHFMCFASVLFLHNTHLSRHRPIRCLFSFNLLSCSRDFLRYGMGFQKRSTSGNNGGTYDSQCDPRPSSNYAAGVVGVAGSPVLTSSHLVVR
jgi:hypothetical protein